MGDTKIAKAIHAKRIAEGLDMRRAAKAAGVSVSTVCRVENGKMPDVENAVRLADWLGLTLDDLFMTRRQPK